MLNESRFLDTFWGHSKRPTMHMLNGGTAEDGQFKGPIFIYSSSQSVKTMSISKESAMDMGSLNYRFSASLECIQLKRDDKMAPN